jgi:hypothetical protein
MATRAHHGQVPERSCGFLQAPVAAAGLSTFWLFVPYDPSVVEFWPTTTK